jgi:hypothetical protein
MNIWTGLLFLDGAVADTSLARELAGDSAREPRAATPAQDDEPAPARNAADRWFTGAGQY